MFSTQRIWLIAGAGLAVAVLVGTGFAFTAGNTVPDTKAGEGVGTITGYNVASVHYTLNTADPSKVDQVSFAVDTAPVAGSTVRVRLDSTGTTWYSCTFTGVNVTCVTTSPQAGLPAANALNVAIAQ